MLHIGIYLPSKTTGDGWHAYGCCDGTTDSDLHLFKLVSFQTSKRLVGGENFEITKQGKLRWLE